MKKRSATPVAVISDPASDDLPEGWRLAPIKDIVDVNPRHPKGLDDSMLVSFAPMAALSEVGPAFVDLHERPYGEVRKGFTHFGEGDVLFAKITPCMENGKGAVATGLRNNIGCGTTELHVLRPHAELEALYLYRFLSQQCIRRDAKETFTSSAGQARVPVQFIKDLEIPLPPIAEQKRIVAKVEELLARVNAARENLDKVPTILKRFRQSVLATACSGRLTWEWRAAQAGRDGSPSRPSSGCLGEASLPVSPQDAETLSEIPETWRWMRLGELGSDPENAIQTGPFGAQLHRSEFVERGVPVVAVGNLTGMGFTRDGLYFITKEKAAQLARYSIDAGDVLFARSGATLGKVCVAPSDARDWRMTGHILRARLNRRTVLPEIAVYALRGDPAVIEQVQGSVRGATRPGYNTGLLEQVLIPVPPLPEQHEIVRRVDRLFALADSIEKQVAAGTARTEKLTQAILAKAFRGELVPTEAELARREGREVEPPI